MRIATMQFQALMVRSQNFNQEKTAKLTTQMASGNRLSLPSDDPVSSVRLSQLRREQSVLNQYIDNIGAVMDRLKNNETQLQSMVESVHSVHDTMVWALDASNATADLNAQVTGLAALRDALFNNGNLRDAEGRYQFSGTKTDVAPLAFDAAAAVGSRYTYAGNTGQQQVVVGVGITQVANANVQDIEKFLNLLDSAIDGLSQSSATAGDPALQATLRACLDGSDTALGQLSGRIASFGGCMSVLQTLSNNHSNVSLANRTTASQLGDLDYGLAATQLNGYQQALQATYLSYGKLSKMSLFDMM